MGPSLQLRTSDWRAAPSTRQRSRCFALTDCPRPAHTLASVSFKIQSGRRRKGKADDGKESASAVRAAKTCRLGALAGSTSGDDYTAVGERARPDDSYGRGPVPEMAPVAVRLMK